MFKIIPHKKGCCAHSCKRKRNPKDRFCSRHRHLYRKFNDPVLYTYFLTKSNAKRRDKEWGITIKEWRKFCEDTNYMTIKGRKVDSGSLDRIDNNIGYFIWNIQILSLSLNSSKGDREVPF